MLKKCYEVSFHTDSIEVEADTLREAVKIARQKMGRLYFETTLVFIDDETQWKYYGYPSAKSVEASIRKDKEREKEPGGL